MLKSVVTALAISTAGLANAATYSIDWTGSGNITMSGTFSFDDSLLGTGAIDETDVDSLSFDVFDNGILIGSSDLTASLTSGYFNLNFDTDTEQFLVGGNSYTSTSGQEWGSDSTFRFRSGAAGQLVTSATAGDLGFIYVTGSTLTASRVDITAVPLPASAALFLGGFAMLGALRSRRRGE